MWLQGPTQAGTDGTRIGRQKLDQSLARQTIEIMLPASV